MIIDEQYEWDENKNLANQKKHGFDFSEAIRVFDDDTLLEWISNKSAYSEVRYVAVGKLDSILVTIIYTLRIVGNVQKKRIISMRRASKNEKRIYCSNDKG